jgi:hypothetical protein
MPSWIGTFGQQPESIAKSGHELAHLECVDAGTDKLDRERDAIEPTADVGNNRSIGIGQLERSRLEVPRSTTARPPGIRAPGRP